MMPRPRGRSRRRGTRFSARRASRSDRIRGGDPNGRASRTRPSSVLSSPVTRTAWPAAAPPAARARSSPAGEGPSLPRRAWCATRSSSSRSSWRTPRAARSPMGSCASRARCGARGSRRISPRRFHRRGGSSSIRKPRRSAPRSRALSSDWRSRSRELQPAPEDAEPLLLEAARERAEEIFFSSEAARGWLLRARSLREWMP